MYYKPDIHRRNTCIRSEAYNATEKIMLNGQKVRQVSSIKFLGVTIDENLTWLPHIEILKKKLLMCHGTLSRIKASIPKRLHKTIYHALFESHLNYGISVWGAQSQTVLNEIFVIQKKCIRMLFGEESKSDVYCYCKYGESGVMIGCEKCDEWYHDECLGLSENEIANISEFYCAECLNKDSNISIKYIVPPPVNNNVVFCHCKEGEYGLMLECTKCKDWFHQVCINMSKGEISAIQLYYCDSCLATDSSLKIIYKDFTKEHTKPLFNLHKILTVHNLYIYHSLLELYKIHKFRTPYCIYELFTSHSVKTLDLNIHIPHVTKECQKRAFTYGSSILWNKLYKKLITPFSIPIHYEYLKKHNLSNCCSIHYDYSNKVSAFKSNLSRLLIGHQSLGEIVSWMPINYTL